MDSLRTPDERFAGLPGFPYAPHYVEVDGLRVHHVDEGPRGGAVVLLMHGEPSWSYLYRKMIPGLVAAGHRVIAPDLVGFGRSDKPARREDYTYQRHVDWMRAALFERLELRDVTLFCQDWGGLIGLRLVAEHPERFARVVASNTFLPTGDLPLGDAFFRWRDFSQRVPQLPVGPLLQGATLTDLPDDVLAAYEAPFPDESYKEGARQFPMLVPATPDDPACEPNRAAWKVLGAFTKPFLTAFGDSDPITRGADKALQQMVPGCAGQPHTAVKGAHFVQEDAGEELALIVVDWMRKTA